MRLHLQGVPCNATVGKCGHDQSLACGNLELIGYVIYLIFLSIVHVLRNKKHEEQ